MLSVTLKAKHFYYVTNDLKNFAASDYFSLLGRIKTACNGVGDNDDVTVDATVQDLIKVFNIVAYKPEGQSNRINTDMMVMLSTQMEAGVTAQDAEWIEAAGLISTMRNNNWSIADAAIASGKAFLQG